jgi:glycosyltransferase involved in cell wall biosynthesis
MRIVVLNYEYSPLGGGAGRVTQQLCQELDKLGIAQIIITSWFPGLKFRENIGKNFVIIRVPTWRFHVHQATFVTMATYVLMAVIPLLWICWRYRPQLIHAHFLVPVAPLAWLAKKIFNIPYIVTLHGGDVPGYESSTEPMFRLIGSFPYKIALEASQLIAVSENICKLITKNFNIPVKHIPNGISDEWICTQEKIDDGILRIVFAGRLVALKNVGAFLEALAILPNNLPWQLDIFGDGPERKTLEFQALKLQTTYEQTDRIFFHGWVDESELLSTLKKTDMFFLLSDSEGFSVVGLQAMASGCVLIVSDIPGNRPLVKEGINGYFCKLAPESICHAVLHCLPHLPTMSKNSVRMAKAFRYKKNALLYLNIYQHERLNNV